MALVVMESEDCEGIKICQVWAFDWRERLQSTHHLVSSSSGTMAQSAWAVGARGGEGQPTGIWYDSDHHQNLILSDDEQRACNPSQETAGSIIP